jgi:hypothetical protein
MEERRKYERQYLKFFSRVFDRSTRQLIGYLVDLTTGGAMLISEKKLIPEEILHAKIDLPENFSQTNLSITAKVVWSQADEKSELFKSGIQLLNANLEDIDLLTRLVANYGANK